MVALISGSQLLVGVACGRGTYASMKLPTEPRPLLPCCAIDARLRASTAWLMLQLARLRPGDVVLDPMCGVGTSAGLRGGGGAPRARRPAR